MKPVHTTIFFPLCIVGAMLSYPTQAKVIHEHPGIWLGDMQIPKGPKLQFAVDLFKRADGKSWASISLPAQNNFDIPVTQVEEKEDQLRLQFSGKVQMRLKWVKDHFDAEFQEPGGPALSFSMQKTTAMPKQERPQNPKAPFPYEEEELIIPSKNGVFLSATLLRPTGVSKPNLAILVHGAGTANRNQSGEGHESFWVLADQLTRRGIAVLRYDKRGIARSSGDYDAHTWQDLSDDVVAIAKHMRKSARFKKIGAIGHSEGSGIAAVSSAQHGESLDFIVSMAGVGLPGIDMMLLQDHATAIANGADKLEAEAITQFARKYYGILVEQEDPTKRLAMIKEFLARSMKEKALVDKYKMNQGSMALENADKDFMRELLRADRSQDWRKVKVPVLVLNGTLDQQVPLESARGIERSLKQGGNKQVQLKLLPRLNHLFQTATTGAEGEYSKIEETMAHVVFENISAFVRRQ